VRLEVYLIDLSAKAGEGIEAKGLEGKELAGSAREVLARVQDLQRRGTLASVKRVELVAQDRQLAKAHMGENRPYVVGVSKKGIAAAGGFGGPAGFPQTSTSYNYRQIGTLVQARPEIGTDSAVMVDLKVEDSRPATSTDDKESGPTPAEFASVTVETRLNVRPGQVAFVQGQRTGSRWTQSLSLLLVTAEIEENAPRGSR
jgi:type II secretory pathway component GspD/PulD (secretin)